MPDPNRGVSWFLKLLLDPKSKKRVQEEVQDSLEKGTDPKKAKRNVREVESSLGRLIGIAKKVGAALGSIWVVRQVAQYGKAVFDLGARVNAVRSQFETVFGVIAKGLDQSLQGWRRMAGLTRTEMREILAALGSMSQGLGMSQERSADFSTEVLQLAGDLASFSGGAYSTAEAARLLQSALIGNTEAARSLMVNFTAMDVQQRALAMTGKATADSLTQEEKALAALQVITERAGPQVGDLARTQHEADNRAKQLSATWREMKEIIAASLLPVWNALFTEIDRADVLTKLEDAAKAVADNMGEIVATAVALTKALLVGGAIAAVWRLTTAIRAARAATEAWKASMIGAQALMGPKGWLVLGIVALTAAFQRHGRAAREAAKGVDEYMSSLKAMSPEELREQANALKEQRAEIQAEIARLEASGTGSGRIQALKRQIEEINAAGREIARLLSGTGTTAGDAGADGGAGNTTGAKAIQDRIKLLGQAQKLGVLTKEEARELIQLQKDTANALLDANLTLERRVELVERLRALGDITRGIGPLGPEDLRPPEPEAADTIRRERGGRPTAARLTEEEVSWLETNWALVADAGMNAAYGVAGAWQEAFSLIFEEGATAVDFFEALGANMAGAMLGGIAQLASAKVAENIAWALEKAGIGMGMAALGNMPGAALSNASVGQHLAAAAAWAALAGGAGAAQSAVAGGGRGGLSGGVPTGARDIGGRIADQQRNATETHIHLHGDFDALDPRVQEIVVGAYQLGTESAGDYVKLHRHARRGS